MYTQADGQAFEQAEQEAAARGYILDKHNGELVIEWYELNPTVAVNAASVRQAIDQMREKALLHWKSQAQMNYEAAIKSSGLSQQHLDVLGQWLHSRKLIDAGDEGYSNRVQFINYMRGRDWTYDNLDRGIQYIQGTSKIALNWLPTPSQRSNPRAHAVTSEADYNFNPPGTFNQAYTGRPSHSSNPAYNGRAAREQRLAEERRLGRSASDAALQRDHEMTEAYWQRETAKAVAEGRTHSERAQIAKAANQAPGGAAKQAKAAQAEAARLRRARELVRS